MTHIEPTSIDRRGIAFMVARSKQLRTVVRLINLDHNLTSFSTSWVWMLDYFQPYDVLLLEDAVVIILPTNNAFKENTFLEVQALSLLTTDYPVKDVWFDDDTVETVGGNNRCKKIGAEQVLYAPVSISDDEWLSLLGGNNADAL